MVFLSNNFRITVDRAETGSVVKHPTECSEITKDSINEMQLTRLKCKFKVKDQEESMEHKYLAFEMQKIWWTATLSMLSLLLLLIDGCSCNDTPFVINRVANRVEFSELLLGYNYDHADNHSVEVTISFTVRHLFVHSNTISLLCEIFQKWRDLRLKYSGIKSITIPKGIKIWKPDTSFFESDSTYGEESLRLYSDGTICWKQRATLTFPCILDFVFKQSDLSALNCSLIIGSFDNSGAELITYKVDDIILPSNLNLSDAILVMNYTTTTFEEIALNGELMIRTVIHFLIESDQIVRPFNRTEL